VDLAADDRVGAGRLRDVEELGELLGRQVAVGVDVADERSMRPGEPGTQSSPLPHVASEGHDVDVVDRCRRSASADPSVEPSETAITRYGAPCSRSVAATRVTVRTTTSGPGLKNGTTRATP
jgi:hypothetical protein